MGRGRPIGSEIRQRMIEVLYFLKEATGYDIYKVYRSVYPNIALRNVPRIGIRILYKIYLLVYMLEKNLYLQKNTTFYLLVVVVHGSG